MSFCDRTSRREYFLHLRIELLTTYVLDFMLQLRVGEWISSRNARPVARIAGNVRVLLSVNNISVNNICSSEPVLFARSTAVLAASSASFEPSVARSTVAGKMLIPFTS
jgi:hypothetical protein